MTGCLLGGAIRCYQNLTWYEGTTGFYYMEDTVTRQQMKVFWENASEEAKRSIKDVALFRSEKDILAESPSTGRSAKVVKIEAAGSMHLILPGKLRQGSFVSDSDWDGCVVSQKAAEELFGSREVTGERLRLDGREYTVRGIVEAKEKLCMVQQDGENAYPFVRVSAPGIPVSRVQQMLASAVPEPSVGLNGIAEGGLPGWMAESDFYLGLGRMLLWMPAWAVLIFLGLRGRRWIRGMDGAKNKLLIETGKMALPVAVFAGACAILLVSVRLSDDYIPTAWSDFAFWSELVKGKIEAFLFLIRSPLWEADASMLADLAGLACASVGGTAAVWKVLSWIVTPENSEKELLDISRDKS